MLASPLPMKSLNSAYRSASACKFGVYLRPYTSNDGSALARGSSPNFLVEVLVLDDDEDDVPERWNAAHRDARRDEAIVARDGCGPSGEVRRIDDEVLDDAGHPGRAPVLIPRAFQK